MPIIKNNLYHALTTETITKPVSAVKLQLDVLDGCRHKCPGCFVHRRNNASDENQFKDAIKFVDDIASRGILIDEIIIGPTDFLSSENFYEVMPHLVDMINEHSPILAFITTLIDDNIEPWVKWLKESINLNTEIEIGIAIDPHKFQNNKMVCLQCFCQLSTSSYYHHHLICKVHFFCFPPVHRLHQGYLEQWQSQFSLIHLWAIHFWLIFETSFLPHPM